MLNLPAQLGKNLKLNNIKKNEIGILNGILTVISLSAVIFDKSIYTPGTSGLWLRILSIVAKQSLPFLASSLNELYNMNHSYLALLTSCNFSVFVNIR